MTFEIDSDTQRAVGERVVSIRPKVSVIIPTKNEQDAIAQVIHNVKESLDGLESEIIVVDASSDNTPTEAVRAGAKVVRQVGKGGAGEAVTQGMYWAKGDYVAFMDGDATYDTTDIPKLLEPLIKDEADLVNGNRFASMEDGAMPAFNRFGNHFLTAVMNFLFRTNLKDSQSGMKAFKRDILKWVSLIETGFPYCSEILAETAKAQFRISEVGITYKRRVGESKLDPARAGLSIFWSTVKMVFDYRPLILFLGVGLAFIAVGFVIAWPVIIFYWETSTFVYIGRALLATLCWLFGVGSIITGLILNAINTSFERIKGRGGRY